MMDSNTGSHHRVIMNKTWKMQEVLARPHSQRPEDDELEIVSATGGMYGTCNNLFILQLLCYYYY